MNKSLKAALVVISIIAFLTIGVIGLGDALVPLFISFVLSYLLFPLVKKLESKGFKRNYSVITVVSIFFVIVSLAIALIVPSLVSDAKDFITDLPQTSSKALRKVEATLPRFGYEVDLSKNSIANFLEENITSFSKTLFKGITRGLKSSFSGAIKWLLAILNLFLIPLFFFYLVNDFEKISNEIKSFIPTRLRPKLSHYLKLTNSILSGYIRGQLVVALALGILYSFGLSILGLKFGILIGLFSGLICIIPYAGFSLGLLAALITALANDASMGTIIGVFVVFGIVQILEGFIITPKVVGDKVGLGPLATVLALIVGGNLLGLIGMLIAIPVTAVAKSLIKELKLEYQKLDLYN